MSDKMREEFEKWYKSQAVFHKAHLVPLPNGCYSGFVAETAWRAWQAARTVPDDCVVVPRCSTGAMDVVGADAANLEGFDRFKAETVYLAMLSAAPEGKK